MKLFFLIITITFTTTFFLKSDDLIIEIDNPRFSEKGLNDKLYEIKAEKGLKSENELELFIVEGKFKPETNNKWIYLKADKGYFSQLNNHIELVNNIIFYTDEGEKITSNLAIFDMNNEIIKLTENVTHETNEGLIISDSSEISHNFNKVIYFGNVQTIIKNSY